jgi:hypothetical protein
VRSVLDEISNTDIDGVKILAIIFATTLIRRLITSRRKHRRYWRPRLGGRGIGPTIEHISMAHCPDCTPRHPCAIHLEPRPGDDLDRWDAELQARRPWHRRILWEDQHQ